MIVTHIKYSHWGLLYKNLFLVKKIIKILKILEHLKLNFNPSELVIIFI